MFSVLRSRGMKLPERLSAILEVESGSNDPMAIFLTLGLLSFPSRLLAVAWEGLLIALVLILVERPVAVVLAALPLTFNAATSVELLHRCLGFPLPAGIGPEAAARSLGLLLAAGGAERVARVGSLILRPGPDDDHVAVRGGPLRR